MKEKIKGIEEKHEGDENNRTTVRKEETAKIKIKSKKEIKIPPRKRNL